MSESGQGAAAPLLSRSRMYPRPGGHSDAPIVQYLLKTERSERRESDSKRQQGLPWACPGPARHVLTDRTGPIDWANTGYLHLVRLALTENVVGGLARRGAAWRGVAGAARAWSPGPSGDEPCRRVAEGRGGEGLAVGGGTGRYCSHRSTPRNRPPPPRHPLLRAAPRHHAPTLVVRGKKTPCPAPTLRVL